MNHPVWRTNWIVKRPLHYTVYSRAASQAKVISFWSKNHLPFPVHPSMWVKIAVGCGFQNSFVYAY
jgi:hypothetical protein